jgi:hypothetical protein
LSGAVLLIGAHRFFSDLLEVSHHA